MDRNATHAPQCGVPIPPPGWERLAPLVARRRRLGVTQGAISAASGILSAEVCRYERGRVPRVTDRFIERYRSALDRIEEVLDANQGEDDHE